MHAELFAILTLFWPSNVLNFDDFFFSKSNALKKFRSYGYNTRDPALYSPLDKQWPFCSFIFFYCSDHLFVAQQLRMILFWVMRSSKAFLK